MEQKKILFVAGTFDDNGGKKSNLMHQLFESLSHKSITYYNGGSYSFLTEIAKSIINYDVAFWFPDVPNAKPKLLLDLKSLNNKLLLVTSKKNLDGKYKLADLIQHALKNHSNLIAEISNCPLSRDKIIYQARIIDPLGNLFLDYDTDFSNVGKVLESRINELLNYTRVSSKSVGEKILANENYEFYALVRDYATKFHTLIYPDSFNIDRFIGNASFRCTFGFPSYKQDGLIFVTKRNVDKREISEDSFIAVNPKLPIEYFGTDKPSVDTPIQIKLYQFYSNVNYILHAHVYIKNAPFTKKILPCGAIEEADEIFSLYPNSNSANFAVNLKGHGSIILVNDTKYLLNIPYYSRPAPESATDMNSIGGD